MSIVATAGQGLPYRPMIFAIAAWLVGVPALTSPANAADPAKAACQADARRLCPAEVKMMSRSRVRACLITRMDQTTPACHDFMVKARAAALSGHKPGPATQ